MRSHALAEKIVQFVAAILYLYRVHLKNTGRNLGGD